MTTAKRAQRVSTLSRIFAWILFVASTLTLLDFAVNYYNSGSLALSVSDAALIGASFLFCYPLFAYVAITGNSPRWMSTIEKAFDQERGQSDKLATRIFRSFIFRVLFFFLPYEPDRCGRLLRSFR